MNTKTKTLTEQELQIMNVVWKMKQATVRQVYEELRRRRKIAYTTVMTMMNILESKGHLERHLEGRAYVYQPAAPQQRVIAGMVEDFLGRVFDGSARPLVLGLIREKKLSRDDLDEISRMIEETQ